MAAGGRAEGSGGGGNARARGERGSGAGTRGPPAAAAPRMRGREEIGEKSGEK